MTNVGAGREAGPAGSSSGRPPANRMVEQVRSSEKDGRADSPESRETSHLRLSQREGQREGQNEEQREEQGEGKREERRGQGQGQAHGHTGRREGKQGEGGRGGTGKAEQEEGDEERHVFQRLPKLSQRQTSIGNSSELSDGSSSSRSSKGPPTGRRRSASMFGLPYQHSRDTAEEGEAAGEGTGGSGREEGGAADAGALKRTSRRQRERRPHSSTGPLRVREERGLREEEEEEGEVREEEAKAEAEALPKADSPSERVLPSSVLAGSEWQHLLTWAHRSFR